MSVPGQYTALVWSPTWDSWLVRDGVLPTFAVDDVRVTSAETLLAEAFEIRARYLYQPWVTRRDDGGREYLTVLEARDPLPTTLPAGVRWVSPETAIDSPPPIRAVLDTLRDEWRRGVVDERRPAWARQGWIEDAESWIAANAPVTGPIVPVKTWSLSCVLKAPTGDGTVYFKSSAPFALFANEAAVTRNLARRFPGAVPAPRATDDARGWLLLDDLGKSVGETVSDDAEEDNRRLLTQFGAMQRQSSADIDSLLADGCLDRRLERLPEMAKALLGAGAEGDIVDFAGSGDALTDAERAALAKLVTELPERIRRLSDGPIPPAALVHGDLHTGNVARRPDNGFVVFDWTDACVTHPLFDLLLIHNWSQTSAMSPVSNARLRAYQAAWNRVGTRAQRREQWTTARPLFCLHHAISYVHIARGIEPWSRSENGGAILSFVRAALATA